MHNAFVRACLVACLPACALGDMCVYVYVLRGACARARKSLPCVMEREGEERETEKEGRARERRGKKNVRQLSVTQV